MFASMTVADGFCAAIKVFLQPELEIGATAKPVAIPRHEIDEITGCPFMVALHPATQEFIWELDYAHYFNSRRKQFRSHDFSVIPFLMSLIRNRILRAGSISMTRKCLRRMPEI